MSKRNLTQRRRRSQHRRHGGVLNASAPVFVPRKSLQNKSLADLLALHAQLNQQIRAIKVKVDAMIETEKGIQSQEEYLTKMMNESN